jgi:uncharacterized protein (DUF1800 family)
MRKPIKPKVDGFGIRRRNVLLGAVASMLAGCASGPGGNGAKPMKADDKPRAPSTHAPPAKPAVAGLDPQRYAAVNRLTWGANTSTMRAVSALGWQRWLDAQLKPVEQPILPTAVQNQIDALSISQRNLQQIVADVEAQRAASDAVKSDDDKQARRKAYQESLQRLAHEAMKRSLLRALYSPAQIQEHLTWFWFNHFNVHMHKHNLRAAVGDYEDRAIRPNVLGRFRDLLGATLQHPAMLIYLDNAQNAAGRINENYARELMELHTLGVDAGYTQRDVQELARVLTGVGVNLQDRPPPRGARAELYRRNVLFEFHPARHDFGDKQFLGQTIKGQGWPEVEQVLDLLARHPACARFVCRKLAVFFVSDNPPDSLLQRLTQSWAASDGRIAAVMRTLIESPEFAASLPGGQSGAGKFKDPVHYVLSAVRLAYDSNNGDKPIANAMPIVNWLNRMGEGLYNHQTPDGYPMTESAWASPGQMNTRFEIARTLGSGSAGLFKVETDEVMTPPPERPAFPQLANALYYQAIEPTLSPATRQALDQARSPQEWNTYLLSSPEFMLR